MTSKAKAAIAKYGEGFCHKAWLLNRIDGEGAYTIGLQYGFTTRQVDAAIDAWDEVRMEPALPVRI